jgi:hypothetical protein
MTEYIWQIVEEHGAYYLTLRKGVHEVARTRVFTKSELLEKPVEVLRQTSRAMMELGVDWDEQAGIVLKMLSDYLESAKNIDINAVKEYIYDALLCIFRLQVDKEK